MREVTSPLMVILEDFPLAVVFHWDSKRVTNIPKGIGSVSDPVEIVTVYGIVWFPTWMVEEILEVEEPMNLVISFLTTLSFELEVI